MTEYSKDYFKLKDVYIIWDEGEVWLVPKEEGPGKCDGYLDPADWDQSDPTLLFLNWFSMFAIGHYGEMKHLGEVYYKLTHIEEFERFNNVVLHSLPDIGGVRCPKAA